MWMVWQCHTCAVCFTTLESYARKEIIKGDVPPYDLDRTSGLY